MGRGFQSDLLPFVASFFLAEGFSYRIDLSFISRISSISLIISFISINVQMEVDLPASPVGLTATPISSFSILVNWAPPPGQIDKYRLYYRQVGIQIFTFPDPDPVLEYYGLEIRYLYMF